MSSEALHKAYSIRGLKPALKQLLIHLGWRHQWGKPLIQTYQQLADALSLSKRTVCRYLSKLENDGHIRRSPLKTPGKNHLVQVELMFLKEEGGAKQRHKPASNRRRIPRQNGAPLSIEENNPSNSPHPDGITVDARLDPKVFLACCKVIGASEWEREMQSKPVRIFRNSIVEKARRR